MSIIMVSFILINIITIIIILLIKKYSLYFGLFLKIELFIFLPEKLTSYSLLKTIITILSITCKFFRQLY